MRGFIISGRARVILSGHRELAAAERILPGNGAGDAGALRAMGGAEVSQDVDPFADRPRAEIGLARAAAAVDAGAAVEEGPRLAPLLRPGKIMCAGARRAMGPARRKPPTRHAGG